MKKKRFTALILAAMITAAIFTGCNNTNNESADSLEESVSVSSVSNDQGSTSEKEDIFSQNSDEKSEKEAGSEKESEAELDGGEMFSKRDLSGEYDENEAVKITCSDKTFKVEGEGASVSDNVLTIKDEGVYVITGTVKDGRIVVEADDSAKVQIVLNGCSVTSSDYSAIYVKSADKVFLTLADGTENTITDGKTYKDDSEESSVDSAIFSKSDLTVNGTGSLTVNGNMSHAIVSKDDLKITGGNIKVTSAGSAVTGKDSVRIADGTIEITSGGDGIKSTNEEDSSKGYVYISGGKIKITSENDGIQAETQLVLENAEVDLKTGGGNENSSKTHTEEFGGRGPWGNNNTASESSDEDSTSAKGLKSGGNITITNASVNADTADDSIHSNSNVTIASGTLSLTSGDDGIHASTAAVISGGTVKIAKSYEGIEGSSITISGGDIDVTASDDGLNAAGGSDGSAMGGRPGQNSFTANSDVFVKITGGKLHVNSGGDGLDSNNTLVIEGGEVTVDGPTDNGNAAIDFEVSASISGGTLVAVGTSGMAESFSEQSEQGSILYCFSSNHNSGEKITLTTESGEEIISYTAQKNFNAVNLSAPEIKSGGKYILKVGSESVTIEMTSNAYSNGGGMGMGGGMRGGMGDMPDGAMDGGMPQNGGRGGMHGGGMNGFMPDGGQEQNGGSI